MEERYSLSPNEAKNMDIRQLRYAFALTQLWQLGDVQFTYSHYDRVVIGGVMPPQAATVSLPTFTQLKSEYFLERRELGNINLGGAGKITADEETYELSKLDCLYLGKGTKEVQFTSTSTEDPAKFFILSAPAHARRPNRLMKNSEATATQLGSPATSNERTIYKYIHEDGIKSNQLVMGFTVVNQGSVWNTMPAHTHNRRMEVYLYFDVQEEQRVFHLMGEPQQTRHLVLGNGEGVISAPWFIHSGCGTANYSFIWGMAGENQSFSDIDHVAIKDLR
jgi:4-deoxy-L-threo-5-hexosulose-uronate ketol-isomerase